MTVYILRHKNSNFSGTFFAVGFHKGRGSTSSKFDRDRCVSAGCKDITQQYWADQAAKEKKEEAEAAKKEKEAAKKKTEAEKKKETPAPEKEEEKEEAPAPDEEK